MSKAKTGLTRRSFLKHAVAAGAAAGAPMILRPGVLAAAETPGANDRINIAYIGTGRRMRQLMNIPKEGEIVAFADVNKNRLSDMQRIRKAAKVYQDYREMLQDPAIDAVIIATPDHWHALNAIHAMEAGKDVYVEKPMTLTIREGRAMVDAARKHGRICQVGSQQRSMKECRFGCELVRNGRAGAIKRVHGANYPSPWECDLPAQETPEGLDWDMWFGQTEPRAYHEDLYLPRANGKKDAQGRPLGWISFRPWSGGEMTGWGAHGLDIIQWGLGTDLSGPSEVWPEEPGLTGQVRFRYADGVEVWLDGNGPEGGGRFVGADGEILVDRAKFVVSDGISKEEIPAAGTHLPVSDDHMGNWFQCIRSRELPIADVEIGHRSTTMCHLGNIARWAGRPLRWDPQAEQFVDDAEANQYLARSMRAPY
ncbi:MAG: Gfo/Idh/MocA family oxidoreductase, partial [Candidatus Hydrogenedentes bacterium]|nr:Gfo/Idh/MocA family oxidoreductase [Candidatus Hydrogenedentota bacterium]